MQTLLEFLVAEGLVGRVDASRVAQEQQRHGGSIFYNLLKLKLGTAPKLFQFVEEKLGLLYWFADDAGIDTSLLELIPPNIAHFYKIIPVRLEGNVLTMAGAAVSSAQLLPAIEEITGYKAHVLLTHPSVIARALDRYYSPGADAGVFDAASGEKVFVLKDDEKQIRPVSIGMLSETSAAPDWLRTILAEAVIKRSRQVLFRQSEDEALVYFVKEGEPHVEFKLAPGLYQSVASFADYLTGVGPFDTYQPQEKRVKIKISDRTICLQISSTPQTHGRSLTFELYDEKSFEKLFESQFDAETGEDQFVRKLFERRKGLVILSVAPGSQKKLVLYSLLAEAHRLTPAVFSLEESLFYALPGVYQISFGGTTPKVFSRMLETTLKQHPDILAVDSVRDAASMELALLSSSRCLVLAVCSTPDLRGVLRWISDAGLRPALKAKLIPAILQTTSVARLCKYCKKDVFLNEDELARYQVSEYRDTAFHTNAGCPFCKGASLLMEEVLCEVTPVEDALLSQVDSIEETARLRRSAKGGPAGHGQVPFASLLHKGLALAAASKADLRDVLDKCAFLE